MEQFLLFMAANREHVIFLIQHFLWKSLFKDNALVQSSKLLMMSNLIILHTVALQNLTMFYSIPLFCLAKNMFFMKDKLVNNNQKDFLKPCHVG